MIGVVFLYSFYVMLDVKRVVIYTEGLSAE